ncbi:Adenylylsulfatase HINT1-like protein [Drosera capensis]
MRTCSLSYPESTPAPATALRTLAPAPLKSDLVPSFATICLKASKELLYFTASPDVIIILLRTVSIGFDKIINKEIPSKIVYEDDQVLAFRDISPQAPIHILIIPKVKDGLTGLSKAEERHCEILGRLLYTAKLVAKQEGLEDGFRVVINDGPQACQSVYHIHVHLLGGRQMNWPPG